MYIIAQKRTQISKVERRYEIHLYPRLGRSNQKRHNSFVSFLNLLRCFLPRTGDMYRHVPSAYAAILERHCCHYFFTTTRFFFPFCGIKTSNFGGFGKQFRRNYSAKPPKLRLSRYLPWELYGNSAYINDFDVHLRFWRTKDFMLSIPDNIFVAKLSMNLYFACLTRHFDCHEN